MSVLRLDLKEDATRAAIRACVFAQLPPEKRAAIERAVAPLASSAGHCHDVGEVNALIDAQDRAMGFDSPVKEDARAVYAILAAAEAKVHGCPVEQTHFHEVGNHDAIADVLAVCLAIRALAPERITATPVQVGRGQVQCAHGLLDIPAPATAAILERGISVAPQKRDGEWCTPTSAAIILHFVDAFED